MRLLLVKALASQSLGHFNNNQHSTMLLKSYFSREEGYRSWQKGNAHEITLYLDTLTHLLLSRLQKKLVFAFSIWFNNTRFIFVYFFFFAFLGTSWLEKMTIFITLCFAIEILASLTKLALNFSDRRDIKLNVFRWQVTWSTDQVTFQTVGLYI